MQRKMSAEVRKEERNGGKKKEKERLRSISDPPTRRHVSVACVTVMRPEGSHNRGQDELQSGWLTLNTNGGLERRMA